MKKIKIGGQAVIEGVLMRLDDTISIAVRKPDNQIAFKKEEIGRFSNKYKILKLPLIRGIVALFQIIIIGTKALVWSTNQQQEEKEEISNIALSITLIFSFLFALALFGLLPYVTTNFLGFNEQTMPFLFNLVDGILKILILMIYLLVISKMKDVHRLFQYHGAEHKTISCYEANEELNIANIKKYSTIHPRCGTSFLLIVILTGVFIFSFIPLIINLIYPNINNFSGFFRYTIFFISRIALLPLIAGISYEILKIGDKYQKNPVIKLLIMPGLLSQKITTQNPTDDMIEVSIASLKNAISNKK